VTLNPNQFRHLKKVGDPVTWRNLEGASREGVVHRLDYDDEGLPILEVHRPEHGTTHLIYGGQVQG
jgi:YD repeat-containing protein